MAQFIKDIYDARYALSKYKSGKEKYRQGEKELADLMKTAQDALTTLASENITIEYPIVNSENLDETQKKRLLKKEIMKNINEKIKEYLLQVSTTEIKQETAFEDFVTWLK